MLCIRCAYKYEAWNSGKYAPLDMGSLEFNIQKKILCLQFKFVCALPFLDLAMGGIVL